MDSKQSKKLDLSNKKNLTAPQQSLIDYRAGDHAFVCIEHEHLPWSRRKLRFVKFHADCTGGSVQSRNFRGCAFVPEANMSRKRLF